MAKPFYVIALFVTMVTSLVALWNINLSLQKVAFYLSRCSSDAHQKASTGAGLLFCPKESGLSQLIHTGRFSQSGLDIAGKLLGVVPLVPLGITLPQ